MISFTARVTRDGKWWMVDVEGVGLTQARRYSDVRESAAELVAAHLELAGLDEVDITVELGDVGSVDVARAMKEIDDERAKASEFEAQAAMHQRELARSLAAAGLPLRDVGAVLGVSHQRAHQIIHSN